MPAHVEVYGYGSHSEPYGVGHHRVLALLVLLALPAKAESADYETTLDRLGRLQALAEQYIEEKNSGDDPIDLTLSFTRVGIITRPSGS